MQINDNMLFPLLNYHNLGLDFVLTNTHYEERYSFVFVVYTNALGTLLLIPYSFLFHCGERSIFFFSLLSFF